MFRPMLAPQDDPKKNPNFYSQLVFPMMLSPKIDGMRAITSGHRAMSRTWKEHPNIQVQMELTTVDHLDMEVTFGQPTGPLVMTRAQESVRAFNVRGDFQGWVFDCVDPEIIDYPFYERLAEAERRVKGVARLNFLEHIEVDDLDELMFHRERFIGLGYEGMMGRNPMGRYKQGRATMNDQIIWKFKEFDDVEMVCYDIKQGTSNNNALERNALGYVERSTSKAGKVANDMVGAYLCRDADGRPVTVGPGCYTHDQRRAHLVDPSLVIGVPHTVRFFGRTPDGEYRHPRVAARRYD